MALSGDGNAGLVGGVGDNGGVGAAWAVAPLAPGVTSVAPNAGLPAGGTKVTITGTNFAAGATVDFGSVPSSSVTVSSPNLIYAKAPAQAAGTVVSVRVITPGGKSAYTPQDRYAYGRPTVTVVSPAAGPTARWGYGDDHGHRASFRAPTVRFGATAASNVTVVSGTVLQVVVPAGAAGTVDVSVTNAAGTSVSSTQDKYAFGPPAVTRVSPTSGPAAGGNTVTVYGTGFVSGAKVGFGTSVSPKVTFVSGTTVKAVAPSHAAGVVDVTVSTPAGSSASSTADRYTFSGH